MTHKVSILIPSYNQEDVIEQTLQSALSQTYENIEIVVSDDASTDSTPKILKTWQAKYTNKIKVFLHKDNLGVTKNHTRGLKECTGDFVTFLDGDDLFLPQKVEKQVAFFKNEPQCTLCYHDVDVFDSGTERTLYLWSERFETRQGTIEDLIRFGNFLSAVSVMVKKEDLPPSGYDERIKIYSDWFLWINALEKGRGKIFYIPEVLARYRRHAGNLTNKATWKFIDQNLVLDIVESKWPKLRSEARQRRSEVAFMKGINLLSNRQYGAAFAECVRAIKLGFPSFPWLRLILRESVFYVKNGFTSDDILKSILDS